MAVKLGDLLLKAKLITPDQLELALKSQKEEGGKLGEALVRVGVVSESAITETLSQQFGDGALRDDAHANERLAELAAFFLLGLEGELQLIGRDQLRLEEQVPQFDSH